MLIFDIRKIDLHKSNPSVFHKSFFLEKKQIVFLKYANIYFKLVQVWSEKILYYWMN